MHSGHVPILYLVHHGDVQQMDLFDGFSFGVSSFRRRCDLDLSDCVHTSIHAVFKQEKGNWILQNFGESLQVEDPFRFGRIKQFFRKTRSAVCPTKP